jgi:zinc protease
MIKSVVVSITVILLIAVAGGGQTQTTPPPPSAPRSVEFPKPVEQTLPNGLRVIVVEHHEGPLIAASLVIKNGGEVDPPELAGVADLTANLVTQGTVSRSATLIASQIESLGGSLESAAQWDASYVSVGVMADKISSAIEILANVVRRPTFKQDEIERIRQQHLDEITLALGEPGSIARFVGAKVLFGDAPYGHPIQGTPESLKRISRADILKIHRLFYRPDNADLVIGGDIKPSLAFKLAARFFGDWLKPKTKIQEVPKSSADQKTGRVVVIDKPDTGQAAVYVLRLAIDRRDPNYYRGIVTNSVLSGYSGRLNQEIRIKRGLSYGAGSGLDARRDTGPFVASAQTKNESAPIVVELLKSEVEKLATAPPTEMELTPRKAALVGEFSRNLETVSGLVSQISSLALYGLSLDEINHYIDKVQAIKGWDVQKFAEEKLDAKTSDIVIVGNAKEFLPELQKKYSNVELVPLAELDLNTRLLRKKQSHD